MTYDTPSPGKSISIYFDKIIQLSKNPIGDKKCTTLFWLLIITPSNSVNSLLRNFHFQLMNLLSVMNAPARI